MILIDANAILRYILYDNEDMAEQVEDLLENKVVTIKNEVLAEVVYVLEKVYKLPRKEIQSVLEQFLELENIRINDTAVVLLALETFADYKLDFVDTLLYAYCKVMRVDVFTFDKKLLKMMAQQ